MSNFFKILGCGTSTGVPIPGCRCAVCTSANPKNQRLRTSAFISADNRNILIDATIDLRQQALKWDIRRLDAVLFTHAHADHILGVDDLRGFNFIQKTAIPCYGTKRTLSDISTIFYYAFNPDPTYEGGLVPQLILNEIEDYQELDILGVRIQAFMLLHGKLSVSGFRIGNVAYATDCNGIPQRTREMLKGLDCLILDGLRYEEHRTHYTIPQAIKVAQEIGAKKTYLTHMTHAVDYAEVSKALPAGIELAYDGLEIGL